MFDPKYQGETITITFPFLGDLAIGETLSSPVVTAAVYSGVDAAPSSLISGSAAVSGTDVTQKLTAGVVGVIYSLLCTVDTSNGQVLQMTGFMTVLPDAT